MTRRMFELPGHIPAGARVEFFADQACTELAAMGVTVSTSRTPGSSMVMPKSALPALYGPDGAERVWARWTERFEPKRDLFTGAVADRSRAEDEDRVMIARCLEVRLPVVTGGW